MRNPPGIVGQSVRHREAGCGLQVTADDCSLETMVVRRSRVRQGTSVVLLVKRKINVVLLLM